MTKLWEYVARVMKDKPLHWGEISKFDPGNGGRGYGRAWREQLAYDRTYPRSIDLAAWLASSTKGYPAPKPYCPDRYVGTWKQQDPEAATAYTWQFDADGRFHTDEPLCEDRIGWCVHRQNPGPRGDAIWLDDALGIAHMTLLVHDVTPTTLIIQPVSIDGTYRLDRV